MTFLLLFLGGKVVCAQLTDAGVDKANQQLIQDLLGERMDSALLDYLVQENLLNDIRLDEVIPSYAEAFVLPKKQAIEQPKLRLLTPSLRADFFYSNTLGVDSLESIYPSFYNSLSLQTGVQIGRLPVQLNGRMVWTDFEWQQKMSGFSFSFDHQQFLEGYVNQYHLKAPSFTTSEILTLNTPNLRSAPNLEVESPFSEDEMAAVRNEIDFLIYQKIISNPRFVALVSQTDSVAAVYSPSTQVLTAYRESWKKRHAYYGDSLSNIRVKMNQYNLQMAALSNPDRLREKILSDKKIGPVQKLLAASKRLNLGQSVLSNSWYTAKNLPFNGFHYAFAAHRWSGEVAIGRQIFNTHFSPVWSSRLFNQLRGGSLLFAKARYAINDRSWIDYSMIRLKEDGQFNKGVVLAPQNNAVFAVAGESRLLPSFSIRSEWSFSRSIWGNPDLAVGNQISRRNVAGEASVAVHLLANKLDVDLGYFYVGPDFIAAANPFIQINRSGFLVKAQGRPTRNIALEAEVKVGRSIDRKASLGGTQTDVQLMGSMNWQLLKNLTVSAQIAPNYFQQFGVGESNVSNDNMLYNLFVNTQHYVKGHLLIQSYGMTNYNTHLQYVDTSWTNSSTQFYWQSSFAFSEGNSLSLMTMMGFNRDDFAEQTADYSFFSQLSYAWEKRYWKTSLGGQLLRDAFDTDWYYGLTSLLDVSLGTKAKITLDASCQIPRVKDRQTRFWGRLQWIQQF
ncbi:MAG: hypothetical protein AAF990_13475 [Bacteroidota bacterium]